MKFLDLIKTWRYLLLFCLTLGTAIAAAFRPEAESINLNEAIHSKPQVVANSFVTGDLETNAPKLNLLTKEKSKEDDKLASLTDKSAPSKQRLKPEQTFTNIDPNTARASLKPNSELVTQQENKNFADIPNDLSQVETESDLTELLDSLMSGISPIARRSNKPPTQTTNLPEAKKNSDYCIKLSDYTPEIANNTIALVSGFVPKGLRLDSGTKTLCGKPQETGIFNLKIDSTTQFGEKTRINYRLVIVEKTAENSEGRLTITTVQLAVGYLGADYSHQLTATGGKSPTTWNVSGLAEGLTFDAPSGLIAGVPLKEGDYNVNVSVKDSESQESAASFQLIVRTSPVFVTSNTLGEGLIGEYYQARLAAQGGVPPYEWQVLSSALPDGLVFDSTTGSISGEPTAFYKGTLRVKVVDSVESSDSADLPLEIAATTLRITTRALPDGFVGSNYTHTLVAEGGISPYRWNLSGGSLPEGLSISQTGIIAGATNRAGEFSFVVQLADSSSQIVERLLSLRTANIETSPSPSTTPAESFFEPELPGVNDLAAAGSDGKIGLSWQNPKSASFVQAIVLRSESNFPSKVDEGVKIYSGRLDNLLDHNLTNEKTYYYTVFSDHGAAGFSPIKSDVQVSAKARAVQLGKSPEPFVDEVISFSPLDSSGCFNCKLLPNIVLGPPKGDGENAGSGDVVSINARVNDDSSRTPPYGGVITLRFNDNIVTNGPGVDFIVFENAFRLAGTDLYWIEPATVEVSADGIRFYRFPFDFVPHYDSTGELNLTNPFCYSSGFAGVKSVYSNNYQPDPTNPPLAGGDHFDLSDLPGVNMSWIQFVRITSTGDSWLRDVNGDLVRHPSGAPTFAATGKGNSGFDLDAVTAVNY